ncbi:hypothetical protein Q0Z83_060720 [Actinoplanes sichuanensis]|nr:hypothetical protein Q0Z83_060720 [Actinoplanes sichuanensis]
MITIAPNNTCGTSRNRDYETCWSTWGLPLPHTLTVDLGGIWSSVSTLEYLPKQWNRRYLTDGDITSYTISTSADGVTFTEAVSGTWAPDRTTKIAEWPARTAGFVRLEVHAGTGGYANVSGLHIGGRRTAPRRVAPPAPAGGTYRLVARHSGKVAVGSGADVVQGSWTGAAAQTWQILAAVDGYCKIRNVTTGSLIQVAGLSRSNGGNVALGPDEELPQQQWAVTPLGDGYHILINRLSGLALNVAGAGTGDGADIDQWAYNAVTQQQWQLVAEPSAV